MGTVLSFGAKRGSSGGLLRDPVGAVGQATPDEDAGDLPHCLVQCLVSLEPLVWYLQLRHPDTPLLSLLRRLSEQVWKPGASIPPVSLRGELPFLYESSLSPLDCLQRLVSTAFAEDNRDGIVRTLFGAPSAALPQCCSNGVLFPVTIVSGGLENSRLSELFPSARQHFQCRQCDQCSFPLVFPVFFADYEHCRSIDIPNHITLVHRLHESASYSLQSFLYRSGSSKSELCFVSKFRHFETDLWFSCGRDGVSSCLFRPESNNVDEGSLFLYAKTSATATISRSYLTSPSEELRSLAALPFAPAVVSEVLHLFKCDIPAPLAAVTHLISLPPCRIRPLSNHKYLSAVLSCLMSCQWLVNSLVDFSQVLQVSQAFKTDPLSTLLKRFFSQALRDPGGLLNPSPLVEQLPPPFNEMGEQRDASELLEAVLSRLHENALPSPAEGRTESFVYDASQTSQENSRIFRMTTMGGRGGESAVSSLFCGLEIESTTCVSCGLVTNSVGVLRLQVVVPCPTSEQLGLLPTLEECLAAHFGASRPGSACCNAETRVERQISDPPFYLLITLQRFDRDQRKLGASVAICQSLDLSARFLQQEEGERLLYRLISVIAHTGAASSGHYLCWRRLVNGSWAICDGDAAPSLTDVSSTFSSEDAHILLYQRM